jgi:carbamoyl-phosphate synthase small subunit
MRALLLLEDGWSAECESFSGEGESFGELVFNTGLTGYQEILTDPSYRGQIVLMTATMVGNYGIREDEDESTNIQAEGFVVREYSGGELEPKEARNLQRASGYPRYRKKSADGSSGFWHSRIRCSLASYLSSRNVLGVEGIDTRALTRHIREQGAMTAGITTRTLDKGKFLKLLKKVPPMVGRNLVKDVAAEEPYLYSGGNGPRVAVVDCGVKISSLRELAGRGCRVSVFPASCGKKDIFQARPDGVLISNGPGDPAAVPDVISLVESLIGEVPIFGICLGHQIIGLALGGSTYKLKFGHHGSNHPVRDKRTGRVYITTQNHGFNVDGYSLPSNEVEPTYENLNDHTLEGMKHRKHPLFSVQFHPEAGPGPHDTLFLFDEFLDLLRKG